MDWTAAPPPVQSSPHRLTVPVFAPSGAQLGELVLLFADPPTLTPAQSQTLQHLAAACAAFAPDAQPSIPPGGNCAYRYRALTRTTYDIVCDWDLAAGTIEWGDAIRPVLGFDRDTTPNTAQWFFEQLHPDDRPRVEIWIQRTLQDPEPSVTEYRIQKAGGRYISVRHRSQAIYDAQGAPVRLIAALTDISTEREAQARIIELNRRLITILESTTDSVMLLDRNFRVQYLNQRARAQISQGRQLIGASIWEALPETVGTSFEEAYQRAFNTQQPVIVEDEYPLLNLRLEVHAFPTRDSLAIFFRDVRARYEAEESVRQLTAHLQAAQARIERFLESSLDIVTTVSREGIFLDMSPACRRILGYEPAELIGRNFRDLVHPLDFERSVQLGVDALEGRPSQDREIRYFQKSGADVYIRWSVVWSEPDQVFFAIGRDVTQAVYAEQALRESQAFLTRAQEIAHLGSWILDIPAQTVTASAQTLTILGLPHSEQPIARPDFRALVHPEDADRVFHAFDVLLPGGRLEFDFRVLRPDGVVRNAHLIGELPASGDLRVTGTIQDITEREQAEAALRASEERYRQLFDHNPQPMWVYDTHSLRFLAVNQAVIDAYGYTRDDFSKMFVTDLLAPDQVDTFRQMLIARAHEPNRTGEWRQRRKDGSISIVEATSNSIDFLGRPARLVLATDITERRAVEDQLRQAQKMEAVGQLAGGIAHDFNNLLTIINGYATLLRNRLSADPKSRRESEQIIHAGQRAAALTSQLLAFSRRQVLQPKPLNVNETIDGMRPMLRRLISEDIEILIYPETDLALINADPTQFEQVVLNLAINARDAMPHGGRITFETRNVVIGPNETRRFPDVRPGRFVVLSVSDTGEGMTAEIRTRIFEPFFTTKEKGRGTGLGLPTVYGIVKQSGGHITVYSEPYLGTTFKIYLPASEETAIHEVGPTAAATPVGGRESILVVEDDDSVRDFAVSVLRDHGYQILEASSGAEAMLMAERHRGQVDLLLTDVVLPKINGRELANLLESRWPSLKVLFMSGYTENAIVHKGVLDPGISFIPKPFTPDALAVKVREVIDAPKRRRAILLIGHAAPFEPAAAALRSAGCDVHHVTEAPITPLSVPVDLLVLHVHDSSQLARSVRETRGRFPHAKILAIVPEPEAHNARVAALAGGDSAIGTAAPPKELVARISYLLG